MKQEHLMIGGASLLIALAAFQRHPSGKRYAEVWLAALGMIA